jgi:hypothetical protein
MYTDLLTKSTTAKTIANKQLLAEADNSKRRVKDKGEKPC